jgi:hypothetical protein
LIVIKIVNQKFINELLLFQSFSKPNNIHLKKIMSHGMMHNIAHEKNIIRIKKNSNIQLM